MSATEVDFGPSPDGDNSVDTVDRVSDDSDGDNTVDTVDCDNEVTPRLVIAIDFGTYACGIALQWRSDYENTNCLESIKVPTKWSSTGFCTRKTPSCILLKPDKSVAEFGYKADFQFSKNESIPERRRPKDWKDWYFFRYFKMRLYSGEEQLTVDTPMEAANDKHLPMVEVLSKTIGFLKDEAINMLKEDGVVYPEEETKWVITVPAIWNDPAKHVMHEAAEMAGIMGKNLSIALEPECAAIYCTTLPLDKMDVASNTKKTTNIAAPGQTLMVVDMGGGTVDITTVKINEDKTMKQVYKSCGGPWGGTRVNEKFEMFLRDLIGQETIRTFVEKHAIDYYDLRMDFESRKREMKSSDDQIPIKLPDSLRQLWERAEDKEIDDILEGKENFGNIEFMSGRLFLDASIIQKFFQETIDGLQKFLKEDVFSENPNVTVDSLILVGGFAESSYVVHCLRESLKARNIPVVRPQLPELAVLNGAVLFGQNEKIVVSRVMRHTYGVAMTMDFVPEKHREDERYQLGRQLMANNVFRKHVTVGQTVKISEWVSCKEYYPESEKETKTTVYIFTSDSEDPVHTTDKGCTYIGQVDVEFGRGSVPMKKKAVTVEFKFGGTELKVRALTTTGNRTHVRYLKVQ
ncbi:heat shock 70 kDa protein 12B-like [Mercenaria mercenaria]|uniref:heat shock 70 kDa protein 12B-like n=1 Tax=Mercenaria mercenaria TaxID=6596 RepID=UPI00234E6B63|nr:heat shock 70 kDa protein 12B-like [Mercenaria mercenaria]